jgi:serine/threonine-protein kinase
VSEVGGAAELIAGPDIDRAEWSMEYPEFLPDGSAVLYTNWWGFTANEAHVCLLELETGSRRTLIRNACHARYVTTGHVIFVRHGAVHVVAFDAERRELVGRPVPFPESVFVDKDLGLSQLAFSSANTLAFIRGRVGPMRQLVSVDLEGNETPLLDDRRGFSYPRFSPEGERLAVTISEAGGTDIWVINLATGAQTKVTQEGTNCFPVWTPDGERLTYFSIHEDGAAGIAWKRADGIGTAEMLVREEKGESLAPGAWTPDGKMYVYSRNSYLRMDIESGIWAVGRENGRQARHLFSTDPLRGGAAFSPDGRWMAYASSESGQSEIYVQPFPDGGERYQVSTDGGNKPLWSPDGRVIYYRSKTKDQTWAVPVSTTPRFRTGAARLINDGSYAEGIWEVVPNYDIAPDGSSFVMIKPDERWRMATEIRVVFNWFDELERLAPTTRAR